MSELYDACQQYFEIVMADTRALLNEAYQLRYQVLCKENRIPGFDSSQYPGGLEKDTYDDHSAHALLKHRSSGKFIGTVRLVLTDTNKPDKSFPLESHTNSKLDINFFNKNNATRQNTAEISRFFIISEFQRRKNDCVYPQTQNNLSQNSNSDAKSEKDRRISSNITLVLMSAVMRMSVQHGVENWLSFMSPALHRLLSSVGLVATPIGPLIECHGLRRPYFARITDILRRTHKDYQGVWEVLTDQGKYAPANICLYE